MPVLAGIHLFIDCCRTAGTGPPDDLSSEVIVSVVVVLVIIIVLVIILILVAVIAFKKRLYQKFSGETMSFAPSQSHSPRLIEMYVLMADFPLFRFSFLGCW